VFLKNNACSQKGISVTVAGMSGCIHQLGQGMAKTGKLTKSY